MTGIFGLDMPAPDAEELRRATGIRQMRIENGPASGQRLIRIDNASGLAVELWPDRGLDIGQVWLAGVPFGWMGPIGMSDAARLRGNQPLSGLLTTCGFDHIRQPEQDGTLSFPLHGHIVHQPATILTAALIEEGDQPLFRVEAEVGQFRLDAGALRLRRRIEVPLLGRGLRLYDEVRVVSVEMPIMAMYHVNLGYPLAGPGMRLRLNDQDVTEDALGTDGVQTRRAAAGAGRAEAWLHAPGDQCRFGLRFDPEVLPVFQTLRNSAPGINLVCLEPATHERKPREALRAAGCLPASKTGQTHRFDLDLCFGVGPQL